MTCRTALVSAAAVALALIPTSAMAYDAPGYSSTTTDASPVAGQAIVLSVNGAPAIAGKRVLLTVTSNPASLPNDAVQIAGTATATKVADAQGAVDFTVKLTQPGTYSAEATVDGAVISTFALPVTAAASGSTAAASDASNASDEGLADTGFDGAGLAAGAGALVVAGAGAVMIAKRRQTAAL